MYRTSSRWFCPCYWGHSCLSQSCEASARAASETAKAVSSKFSIKIILNWLQNLIFVCKPLDLLLAMVSNTHVYFVIADFEDKSREEEHWFFYGQRFWTHWLRSTREDRYENGCIAPSQLFSKTECKVLSLIIQIALALSFEACTQLSAHSFPSLLFNHAYAMWSHAY